MSKIRLHFNNGLELKFDKDFINEIVIPLNNNFLVVDGQGKHEFKDKRLKF